MGHGWSTVLTSESVLDGLVSLSISLFLEPDDSVSTEQKHGSKHQLTSSQRRRIRLQRSTHLHLHLRISHPDFRPVCSVSFSVYYTGTIHPRGVYGHNLDPDVQEFGRAPQPYHLGCYCLRFHAHPIHSVLVWSAR